MKKTVIQCVTALLCVIAVAVTSVISVGKISTAKVDAAKAATGIHLHLGLKKLSGGDWLDPEKWSGESFKPKDSSAAEKYSPGNYRVSKADVLNVRKGASTSS